MFEELKEEITVNKLSQKVNDLLVRFEELKSQNEVLRQEVVTLKAQNEAKDAQIAKLDEELMMKDLEIEEVIGKIETMLSE